MNVIHLCITIENMQHRIITPYAYRKNKFNQVSEREYTVLKLIAEGYSSIQIAERLFLSYETIRSHRKNLMRKLEATNTALLITKSFRTGLLTAS